MTTGLIEHIPALSGAMDKRVRLLDASVDFMTKLQKRIEESNVDLMSLPEAVDLLKVMSHQFSEVLEACRRCSADELVDRLDNLHLYQLIQNLTPDEKDRVRRVLASLQSERTVEAVEVGSVSVTEVVNGPPASPL